MQKIRITGVFFEKKRGYIDSLKWKKFLQTALLGYIFIYVQIKYLYIIPDMYLTTGGKFQAIKGCSTITVRNVYLKGQG